MAVFSLCFHVVHVCVLISFYLFYFFYKNTSHIGLGPTYVASFLVKYLLKELISKYSHILSYWGLGL